MVGAEPQEKDIRFIDSSYNELFRIPDGGYIQVDFPDETIIKPCKYLDDYHTQIGNRVFHICEFAEIMERLGANYQAEPPIMSDEAAWKIGKDSYLMIQTCEDGYDYTFYDQNYQMQDGGQLDNPELSMLEARKELLTDMGLTAIDLRAVPIEEVIERAEQAEMKKFSVLEKLSKAAENAPLARATRKDTEPEL